jgi:catechol 2,3-dioxygenase-like lactoylglutathione lyase family enzyme
MLAAMTTTATPRWSMVINCADIDRMSEFWCAVLGLTPRTNGTQFRVLEGPHGMVALQVADDPVTYRHQMHVDFYCAPDVHDAECERVRQLGATFVRESDEPDDVYVVFADPEGNEFCVCAVEDERRFG